MTAAQKLAFTAGAALALIGVACGAFAAHALKARLGPTALGWWETAVQYQMWHAIGLIALAALAPPRLRAAALLIGFGTVIFAGTLYAMALTGLRWLGAITPVGGTLMIAGWAVTLWPSHTDQNRL